MTENEAKEIAKNENNLFGHLLCRCTKCKWIGKFSALTVSLPWIMRSCPTCGKAFYVRVISNETGDIELLNAQREARRSKQASSTFMRNYGIART